jgi:hypothetical protein
MFFHGIGPTHDQDTATAGLVYMFDVHDAREPKLQAFNA